MYSLTSQKTGTFIENAPKLKGEVFADKWPGVVTGSGVSQAQRVANAVALQEAITYAYNNKMTFVIPPATYEIEVAAGLVIPYGYNGFTWKGNRRGSIIIQYYSDAPCLVVGAVGGAESAGIIIDGVSLMYGVTQTGLSSAALLKIGKVWQCVFRNISAGGNGSYLPYYSCHIAGTSFYFSNTMEDCAFRSAQQTSLHVNNFGTGNVFKNLYVTKGGAPTAETSNGPVVRFDTGGGAQYENQIDQLNIEWGINGNLLVMQQARNMVFSSTHFEGCRLTGSNPGFIKMTGSQCTFNGLTFLNCAANTSDSASGTTHIFFGDYRSDVVVNGLCYWQDNVSYSGCDLPFLLMNSYSPNNRHQNTCTVNGFVLIDVKTSVPTFTNFRLSSDCSASGYQLGGTGNYCRLAQIRLSRPVAQVSGGGIIDIPDADKTLYGFVSEVTYNTPAALAATRTLTLSKFMGPAATSGAAIPVPTGQMVSVLRGSTASGSNALVNNWDGTLLATMSTSDQIEHFYFNGTNWVKV